MDSLSSHSDQYIRSYCDWWTMSGLEAGAGETPAGWLDNPPAKSPPVASPPAASPPAASPTLSRAKTQLQPAPPAHPQPAFPHIWSDFQQWLAESPEVPGVDWPGWQGPRILPTGPQRAPLMILSLCPEIADGTTSHLFSPPAKRLLTRMLRAIGHNAEDCYWTALALTRPPAGHIERSHTAPLTALLHHHIAMAAPTRLLLIGQDVQNIIAPKGPSEPSRRFTSLQNISYHSGKIEAMTIPIPAMLLDKPKRKAATWPALRLLAELSQSS